jgi:hypothetical protein
VTWHAARTFDPAIPTNVHFCCDTARVTLWPERTCQPVGAAQESRDMVVVGTRGGGFPHLNLGAVSSQVVYHAKCPIVVVPYGR